MNGISVVVLVYLALNVVAFLLYGADKRKAKKDAWRIKESTLLFVSFFGPFGAIAGMRSFRHKTRKNMFKIVYVFAILHIAVIILMIYHQF